MKTFYDLETKEREKYYKEFCNTVKGKEISKNRKAIWTIAFILLALSIALDIALSEITKNIKDIVDFVDNLLLWWGALSIGYNIWEQINFTSWLKIKHDIKRW